MKACPFCAEEIQDAAIVCRFCGRELKQRVWKYLMRVLHFRNDNESGWLYDNDTPQAALAAQHLWNQWWKSLAKWDEDLARYGWEPVEPRGAACVEVTRATTATGVAKAALVLAIFATAGNLLVKWWATSITLRSRKPADTPGEEIRNYWINPKINKWERMEQDPADQKWYIWRRPADYNSEDPNDDRWDKIPF